MDFAVVEDESVGDVTEFLQRIDIVGTHGLATEVAAGDHERAIAKQQVNA